MSFYSPLGFIALIAVPAIIILYLLKKRHQDYTISSLYLWEEVLKDIEANAPWQKLRKNILMILQILAAVLLAFTLAKPFINALGSEAAKVIVVLDTSLSMQANDVGRSRFDEAKLKAKEYINNLKPGAYVTLINMGRNAIIEENLSNNKNSLLEKLEGISVTNTSSNIEDVQSLTLSLAKQHPGTKVVVFGDKEFKLAGVDASFSNITSYGDNFAVTLLSHTRNEKGLTVLSRIANYGSADVEVPVSLYADGSVFDAKNVKISKGSVSNVYWNDVPASIKFLEVRIDAKDSLEIDNKAWNAVNESKTNRVLLVSDSNSFIEKVISLSNGVELFKAGYEDMRDLKGYDLYIFDGILPEELPRDGSLMVFNPTQNKFFTVSGEVKGTTIEYQDDEIFKYVDSFDFSIGKTKILEVPKWGKEILRLKEGTSAFYGQYENRRVLAIGFDIHNTDIPLTAAFPIFITNALEWLLPSTIRNIENVYPGEGISFNLNPKAQEATVLTPSGKSIKVAPPFPALTFGDTDEIGLYTLKQKTPDGNADFYFTVNVPSELESDLKYSQAEETAQPVGAESSKKHLNTGMNLQGIFLWFILIVLLIEWWVYTNGV